MVQNQRTKYYPTLISAVHLLVLYIFIQALVDFPLALYDYEKGTDLISNFWINLLSNIAITFFIFFYGFKKTKGKFKEVFSLRFFNILLIVPVLLTLPALQYLVGFLNIEVHKVLPPPPWFWELFEKVFESRFGMLGVYLKVALFAPIIEEALFRGIMMYGLMRNYKGWVAVLASALLFSVFHLNPWQMTYTFFLGLFLGFVMLKTRSLPLAILIHSLNNLLVLVSINHSEYTENLFFNQWVTANKTYLAFGVIVFSIGLVLLFTRKRKSTKKTYLEIDKIKPQAEENNV